MFPQTNPSSFGVITKQLHKHLVVALTMALMFVRISNTRKTVRESLVVLHLFLAPYQVMPFCCLLFFTFQIRESLFNSIRRNRMRRIAQYDRSSIASTSTQLSPPGKSVINLTSSRDKMTRVNASQNCSKRLPSKLNLSTNGTLCMCQIKYEWLKISLFFIRATDFSSLFCSHFFSFTAGSIHGKENFKQRGEIPTSKSYDTKL